MSISNVNEISSLFSIPGVPTRVRDKRQPYEKQLAVYLILACVLLERTTFYIVDISVGSTLESSRNNTLHWNFTNADNAGKIFEGFPLYLTGLTLFTFIANEEPHYCPTHQGNSSVYGYCADWIYPSLILTAIGEAAVRVNLIVFGADQVQESQLTSRYFDKCVIVVNVASIITTLSGEYMPDKGAYWFGIFMIATSFLFVCGLLFFIGLSWYIYVPSHESVLINCIPVIINAIQSWWRNRHTNISTENHTNASNRSSNEETIQIIRDDERPPTFLDYAKQVYNGKYHDRIVDDVRSFRNALIILFILVLPHRIAFAQLYTTFQYQAKHMKHSYNDVSKILLSEPIAAIVCIIILNMFVYKYLQARNRSLTIANKFIISMIFAFIGIYIAGGIEILRQYYCPEIHGKELSKISNGHRSNLTIFFQLPQDIATGFAQSFSVLATFEFAYFVAPRSAQSLFLSLYFCSVGAAGYINRWYTELLQANGINMKFRCPVEQNSWIDPTYFFILAGILFIFIIIFILCQRKAGMIRLNRQHTERRVFLRHTSTSIIDSQ